MFVSATNTNAEILSAAPKLFFGSHLAENFANLNKKMDLIRILTNSTIMTVSYTCLLYTSTNELHRTEHIQLSVDYAQHGLGSASWGAECLEKDRLHPEPFAFTWKIFGAEREKLADKAEQYRRR